MEKNKDIYEITIHGRGGQGAKTAATVLAQTALEKGFFIQAFPEYGAERQGAPMRAFTRISKNPIRLHSNVYEPDLVVIIDPTLINPARVEGLKEDKILIINANDTVQSIREKTGFKGKIFVIDATKISLETMGKNIPNTPILGAIEKATNMFGMEYIKDEFKRKFLAKFNPQMIDANIKAIERGYNEVKTG